MQVPHDGDVYAVYFGLGRAERRAGWVGDNSVQPSLVMMGERMKLMTAPTKLMGARTKFVTAPT
jgi:hypothetical protein